MRAPIADFFSLLPHLLVDQAFHSDFALFPTPYGEVWLAFWVRIAKVTPEDGVLATADGKAFGHELVAYHCDHTGRVLDWERRYEMTCSQQNTIVPKLRSLIANDLTWLHNYEGLLDEIEARWSGDAALVDWDEMPDKLQ